MDFETGLALLRSKATSTVVALDRVPLSTVALQRWEEECLKETPSAGQLLGHKFKVGMEFDICLLFVFLGTLVALSSRKRGNSFLAVLVDVLFSFYLLYSTYGRNFIIRHTEVAQWMSEFCAEGAGALIRDYIFFSVVSWIASSALECSSSLHLAKLYKTKLKPLAAVFWRMKLSEGRFIVLMTAVFCIITSLALTMVLWGFVQRSLGSLAQDAVILVVLTIAAFLRLTRQLMEGVTLISGIATKAFKWRNPDSKFMFGRIAFSSSVLLIHSSSLTYTFAMQEKKVWGSTQCVIFMGLCVDIFFRLFVCGWATLNSCCVSRLIGFVAEGQRAFHSAPTRFVSVVNITQLWHRVTCVRVLENTPVFVAHFGPLLDVYIAMFVQYSIRCHQFIRYIFTILWHARLFLYLSARYLWHCLTRLFHSVIHIFISSVRLIFVVLHNVLYGVVAVLSQMWAARRAYILRRQDENLQLAEEEEGPLLEPYLLGQVRQETDENHERQEIILPFISLPRHHQDNRVCESCPELVAQHLARTSDTPSRDDPVLPFPPRLGREEPPPIAPQSSFADPPIVGNPFPLCRLEVRCEQA